MEFLNLAPLVLALPFAMFLIIGLFGYKMCPKFAGILGTSVFALTSIVCYGIAIQYFVANKGKQKPKQEKKNKQTKHKTQKHQNTKPNK